MKLTNEERRAIYRRDGWRCALCDNGQTNQIHHYIHRGRGGSNSPHNLITLCSTCHGQIHGYLLEGDLTQEHVDQACVEYLADMYAPDWNPWRRE